MRFKIYELYNFVDGNDDILSDIGNTDEVRQGMWALLPYGVDDSAMNEVEIPPVKPYTAGEKEYGIWLANLLAKKVNLPTPNYITSGGFGHAFRIGNDKVLKITSNISEAESAFKTLRHGPPKYLTEIFKIYKIVDTQNNITLFAIIQEYIPDRPTNKFDRYNDVINTIMPNNFDFIQIVKKMKRAEKFNYNEIADIAKHLLSDNPDVDIDDFERKDTYGYLMGLLNIQQELHNFGIKSDDYTNVGNLGYKNGVLKFFDVGEVFGKIEPDVPDQDIVHLPESINNLTEDYDRNTADNIANKVAELKGYQKPKFIGSGTLGVAYDIGNDRVLKITKDNSEAAENLELINKPLKYIAQPYNVFKVTQKSNPLSGNTLRDTYAIVLEKLDTSNYQEIKRLFHRLNFILETVIKVGLIDVIDYYLGDTFNNVVDKTKMENIKRYFSKNPKDAEFFGGLLRIAEEAKTYGIESTDFYNADNLGYKKSGALGFFDVGFGNFLFKPHPEEIEVDEDGSSRFSTDNSLGQDDFPAYNQKDTSPVTDNNIPTSVDEDLEYNHVDDATKDEYIMTERKLSYMPGAQSVDVKKKCRLGGLGNTSAACNQGDINNLDIKPLKESYIPNKTFWGWVSPDNQFYEVPTLKHKDFIMRQYRDRDFGWDYDRVFDAAMKDGWVRVIYEKFPNDFRSELSLNGYNKDRVKQVFKDMFFDLVKYGNNAIYLDYEEPKGHQVFSTRDGEGKAKMVDYALNENREYQGNAYRVDSGFNNKGKTAGDVVRFERDELGNVEDFAHITDEKLKELDTYSARNMVWVTKTYEDAKRYSNEDDFSDIEEFEVNGEVIAEDGDGGYLILTKELITEIYDELGSLKKVLSGKRNVDFITLDKSNIGKVQKYNIGVIPVRMESGSSIKCIIYNDKGKDSAHMLYAITKKHGGFLNDDSPEEARLIGHILGHSDATIEEYIRRKYQLNEQNIDIQTFDKKFIRKEDDADIIAVDGASVKEQGFIEFVEGGHHYVDAKDKEKKYAKHIPENEIWIDNVFLSKPEDLEGIILHEKFERYLMKNLGFTYSKAHNFANNVEILFRQKVNDGAGTDIGDKIFTIAIKLITEKKSKFNEEIQLGNINEVEIASLEQLPFKQEVEQLGGKIYSVGGAVRDEILGMESKDLDVLITEIPMDKLEQILSKYGRVDAVGKSFGVLKFKAKGAAEEIDIAIPRTEKPSGEGGHKGFDVTSDHALPIEKDLERRDFTINAIAKDIEGNIVDPFGGQEDLKNKIIKIVNPEAFSDDPLRMLRAVQFAARFGFTIEPETLKMIQSNAGRIKEIPPERILTEFDKIVKRGDKFIGAFLLFKTGLLRQIFGNDAGGFTIGKNIWKSIKTMGEFIFLLSQHNIKNPAEFYKNNLKGDVDAYKEIKAIQMAFESGEATNMIEARAVASNMYLISPQSLQSQIIPDVIRIAAQELSQGKYPKTVNELAINGNDLMELGLKGKEVGDMQKSLLLKIYSGKVNNNREDLLKLSGKKDNIDELYMSPTDTTLYNMERLKVNYLVKKYDEWNKVNGELKYPDPMKETVKEFLKEKFPDILYDKKLTNALYYELSDREVLNEN